MPRSNKKTRIKGLPPRLQLQQKDARTGSYSSQVRIASDNRTGNYSVKFDDTNAVNFGSIARFDNVFLGGVPVNGRDLLGYWKFNSGSFVSTSNGNWKVDYPLVPNGAGYSETQLGGVGKNYTDAQLTMYVTGNTQQAVVPITDDLPFPLRVGGEGNPFGEIAGALKFQHNVSSNSALWSVASIYSGTLLAPIEGAGVGEKDFLVSAWIKVTASSYSNSGSFTIACKAALGRSDIDWSLELDNNGALVFSLYDDLSNKIEVSSSRTVPLNEWTMVRAGCLPTFGEEDLWVQIGKNGKESESNLGSVGTYTGQTYNSNPVLIGAYDLATPNFPGYICEVAFWTHEVGPEHELQPGTAGLALPEIQDSLLAPVNGVVAGIGLNKNSKWLEDSEQYTDIILTSGSIRAGIGDTQVHFTPGQDLTPFKDSGNPAVDGKSTNNSFYTTGSKVTEAGEGFTSPLWSKTKIEVPINVRSDIQFDTYIATQRWTTGNNNFVGVNKGVNWPITYYNFNDQTWSGQGLGITYAALTQSRDLGKGPYYNPFKDYNMMAFASSPVMYPPDGTVGVWNNIISGVFEWQASAGTPISNYGFPFHPKFHATASNLLSISNYITRPFLVEKIFIQLSASFAWQAETYTTASFSGLAGETITSITESVVPACVNNVFLMNQRKGAKFTNVQRVEYLVYNAANPLNDSLINVSVPTTFNVNSTTEKIYVDTSRELVAYGGITSFAANMPPTESLRAGSTALFTNVPPVINNPTQLLSREVNIVSSEEAHDNLSPLSWTGVIQLELQARSPIEVDRVNANADNVFSLHAQASDSTYIVYADSKFSFGGRNGLGLGNPSGKDRRSPTAAVQPIEKFNNAFSLGKENILLPYKQHTIPNGYLLEPGDELILGWQQPVPMFIYPTGSDGGTDPDSKNVWDNAVLTSITFHPHPEAKIILYGSEIREDQEHHDTLNQLLTSIAIHEVIE